MVKMSIINKKIESLKSLKGLSSDLDKKITRKIGVLELLLKMQPEAVEKTGSSTNWDKQHTTALGVVVGEVGKHPDLEKYLKGNKIQLAKLKKLSRSELISLANKVKPAKAHLLRKEKPEQIEVAYVDFMNKDKGFKADKKYFTGIGYEANKKAIKWAKNEFEKFDMDMVGTLNPKERDEYLAKQDKPKDKPKAINSLNWKKLFKYPEKFKDYDGKFLFPPRIKHRLQPKSLSKFDNESYVGQPKLNGSSCSIILSENSTIVKERHNTDFSRPPAFPVLNPDLVYLGVPLHRGNGFMCLVGEFMNKSKKDDSGKAFSGVCIWDIVAFENKILVGSTIEERINLLDDLYPNKEALTTENGTPYLFKTAVPDVFKVNNFYKDFSEIYKQLIGVDMVEGFVLKRKSGKLEMMVREENNTGWSVKVRKPTKNYQF